MSGNLELRRPADRLDRLLQRAVGKGREPAALIADQMVVMQLWVDPLVAGRVAADLDPLHEVEAVELIEGPVDARPADRVEPPIDLQRRKRAGLTGEQLNHLASRSATAVTGLIEALNRCFGPTHGREGIR